jgi:hypothetical protein
MDRPTLLASRRRRAGWSLAIIASVLVLSACSTSAAPALATQAPGASGPGAPGNSSGGLPASVKDPCVLLTATDAKGLLAMADTPTALKTGVPFLSCAYSTNSGAEALILAISTNSLAIEKLGVDSAQDLPGLGDAAFVAGGGRNAVVVWTSGGATYKLSWNTLSTAGRTATTDPVVALAKTIASRI